MNASTGAITGTVTAACAGSYSPTFTVTDSGTPTKLTASQSLTILLTAAPAISFGTTPAVTGTFNVAYSSAVVATGGAGTLTYSLASGSLPPDLALAGSGAITGTPKAADVGTWTYAVKAADAFGDSATSTSYSLVVSYPQLTITTPATLTAGYGNTAYSQTLAATGGNGGPYTWSVTSGASSLAALNLSLSSAGVLSGTAPLAGGTASFTAKAVDSASNSASTTFSLTIHAGVSITTSATLPGGYGNTAYSQALAATGGSGSGYTWSVTSGASSLAALNLSLSSAGLLSGTPPVAGGTVSFTAKVVDSASNAATATFSLLISAGVTVSAPSLAAAYPGSAYASSAFTAAGGSNSGFTWSLAAASGSSVPTGFAIGSATGIISATSPVNAGSSSATYNVVVTASDSLGNKGSANVTLTIEGVVTVTTGTSLYGTIGIAYSQQLAASGGSGTYTWQQISSTLNTVGLSFNAATGVISGASPTLGTGTLTVTATDSQSHVSSQVTFTVTISNQLVINQTSLPSGDAGSSYSTTLTASGGSGSGYTFTATSSNLSTYGLSLSSSGSITGTPSQSGTASFTANVKDSANNTAQQALSITIYGGLSLPTPDPSSLPSTGYTAQSYSGSITGSGGSGSYSWTVSGLSGTGLSASPSGGTLSVSGSPTSPGTITFNVTLKDTTTNNSITQNSYTISVTNPVAVALPSPNPGSLGSATVSQSYSGSIMASGGVPPYTWTVNGAATAGAGVSLGNGTLAATSTGGSTLTITGTPSATGTVTLTNVRVVDSTQPTSTSATQTYSITVNPSGGSLRGQISMSNLCNSGGTLPVTFTLTATPASGSPEQTTTDSNGNYSFTNLPFGTYTITASVPGAASTLFYPTNYTNVTLSSSNSSVTGENFSAQVGYNVSGTVSYSGSQTGQVYLYLNSSCGGGQYTPGTSITEATLTSGGAYTIHGVQPGSYTLSVWMDSTGVTSGTGYPGPQGVFNANNPTGTSSSFNVTNANATGIGVTLTNPSYATPASNPRIEAVIPNASGVTIFAEPPTVSNSSGNSEEAANEYAVEWAVSNGSDSDGATCSLNSSGGSFVTVAGSHTFYAVGKTTPILLLNNAVAGSGTFTSGQAYCFQVRAFNTLAGTTHPSGWTTLTDNDGNAEAVTIATPNCSGTCTTVSGTVTIPAGTTIATGAPLYVGLYQQSSGSGGPSALYAMPIANPVVGANNYSMTIPSGSNYFLFGILDQNNDGQVDAGDITFGLHNNGFNSGATISGSSMTENATLPTANSAATVVTQYTDCGTSCGTYALQLSVAESNKLPVGVTLSSGPNMLSPVDLSTCGGDCNGANGFQYNNAIPGGTPSVGDQYDFTVTYSDGSQDTGTTVNGQVTGWNGGSAVAGSSDAPSGLAPSGTSSTSTQPTFTWTDASAASGTGFFYSFSLIQESGCTSNCTIWQIPGSSSNSSGFSSSTTSILWGTDPTGGGSTPSVGSLTSGTQYSWTVEVQDSNGNQAQTTSTYTP